MASAPDVVEVDDTLVAWGDLARAHLRAWRRGRVDARSSPSPAAPARRRRRSSAPPSCIGRALPRDRREPEQPRRRPRGRLRPRAPAPLCGLRGRHELPRRDRRAGAHPRARRRRRHERRHRARRGRGRNARRRGAREGRSLRRARGARSRSPASTTPPPWRSSPAPARAARGPSARATTRTTGSSSGPKRALPARASASGGAVSSPRRTRGCLCSGRRPPSTWPRRSPRRSRWPARSPTTRSPRRSATRFRRGAAAGRMQVRQLADGTLLLDDTYNANPQSVRAALRTLREVAQGRAPWWSSARCGSSARPRRTSTRRSARPSSRPGPGSR